MNGQRELIDEKFKEKWGNCHVCQGTNGLKHQEINDKRLMLCDDCRHALSLFGTMTDTELSAYSRICSMGIAAMSSEATRRLNAYHKIVVDRVIAIRAA